MKSTKYLLLLLYLFSAGSVHALELGQIKVDSHLNERLNASFSISNISADNLGDIKVNIADIPSYELLGLTRPSYVTRFIFTIMPGQGLEHLVKVSSRQRIREPIIELLVNVTEKQSKVMRLYTVMLDPATEGFYAEKQQQDSGVVASTVDSITDPATETRPASGIDEPPIAIESNGTVIAQDVSRIRVDNTSLSLIAQSLELHKEYSVYQIMRALYLENPGVFTRGNINRLQSGSLLTIPATELVAEVSRQEAIKFVNAASSDSPFVEGPEMPSSPALKSRSALADIPAPAVPAGTGLIEEVPSMQVSQDIQQDLVSWRGMTNEFKTLSNIVEAQNRAIKLQSNVLQEMGVQLNTNSNDFVQLGLRLNVLETLPQSSSLTDGEMTTNAAQGLLAELNRVKEFQSKSIDAVNEQLDFKNQQILGLNSRIEVLEKQQLSPVPNNLLVGPQKIFPDENNSMLSSPAALEVFSLDSWSGIKNGLLIGLFVINALVLMFVLRREYTWRRRLQASTASKRQSTYSKSNHVKHKSQGAHAIAAPPGEFSPVTSNVQQSTAGARVPEPTGAVQKQEEVKTEQKLPSKTAMKPGKVSKPASRSRSILEINPVKQVHSEIDVLIAYELFSEAQELVEANRKIDKEDHWLLLKELEILAYLKEAEQFFAKFEEEKNLLSKEFPVAWNKIVKMRASLISEFKLKAIH